jgi:hypothetical protein
MAYDLQRRLDAFVSGECSPTAFALELSALCQSTPDRAWDALSLIDQNYRRGKLSANLYRTFSHNIERQVLGIQGPDAIGQVPGMAFAGAEAAMTLRVIAPGESAREVLALHSQLDTTRAKLQRYRTRIAILSGFGRHQRSALATALQDLQVSRAQAQAYLEELRSGGWRRPVRTRPTDQTDVAAGARDPLPRRWPVRVSLAVSSAAVVLCVGAAPSQRESPSHIRASMISMRSVAAPLVTSTAQLPMPERGQITLSTDKYVVLPGKARAEVLVRRSGGTGGEVDFVWWAEGSGAKAGEDFVSRTPRRARMLDGVDSVQLSIPILANPSRRHTEMFFVAIGAVDGGAVLGSIRRAAVFIMRAD